MLSPITPVPVYPTQATQLQVNDSWFYDVTKGATFNYALLDANSVPLISGQNSLSPAQWSAWTTQSDATYILSCVAANLNLTLTPPATPPASP